MMTFYKSTQCFRIAASKLGKKQTIRVDAQAETDSCNPKCNAHQHTDLS